MGYGVWVPIEASHPSLVLAVEHLEPVLVALLLFGCLVIEGQYAVAFASGSVGSE